MNATYCNTKNKKNLSTISVAIADDHIFFREGFGNAIARNKNFSLVGQSANGEALLQTVRNTRPDVVVTDVYMPVLDGIAATHAIKTEFPNTKVIALSMSCDDETIWQMYEAGATGYLLKEAGCDQIYDAITSISNERSWWLGPDSERLFQVIKNKVKSPKPTQEQNKYLSQRESKVLELICQEKSNKEIAKGLGLSVKIIENTRERVRHKIDARNTVGLVKYAIKNKIFSI